MLLREESACQLWICYEPDHNDSSCCNKLNRKKRVPIACNGQTDMANMSHRATGVVVASSVMMCLLLSLTTFFAGCEQQG